MRSYRLRVNWEFCHPLGEIDPCIIISSGEVSELVDEHDLGSCAERRGSSSLPFPTTGVQRLVPTKYKSIGKTGG